MDGLGSNKSNLSIYIGLIIVLMGSTVFWLPSVYKTILSDDFEVRNYSMQLADWAIVGLIICFILFLEKNKLSSLNIKKINSDSFSLGMALGGLSMIYIVIHKLFLAPFLTFRHEAAVSNINSGIDSVGPEFIFVFGIFNVMTAGVAEEIIYRGYATERLLMLKSSKVIVFLLPLIAFVLMHYRKGFEHMILVLIVGALFQLFYLKYRNLTITIIGHLLIDSLAYTSILMGHFK